jgi:hypothetical protein
MCYNFGIWFFFFSKSICPQEKKLEKNMKLSNCEIFEVPQRRLKFALKKTHISHLSHVKCQKHYIYTYKIGVVPLTIMYVSKITIYLFLDFTF